MAEYRVLEKPTFRIAYPSEQRWTCTRCIQCCRDTPTKKRRIRLLPSEIEEIATVTGMRPDDYSEVKNGQEPFLREMRKKPNGECVFLDGNTCTIYENRPLVCRFYPFYLVRTDEEDFQFGVTREPCQGLGEGEPKSKEFYLDLFKLALKRIESEVAK